MLLSSQEVLNKGRSFYEHFYIRGSMSWGLDGLDWWHMWLKEGFKIEADKDMLA